MKTYHTYQEIQSQPQIWAQTQNIIKENIQQTKTWLQNHNFDSAVFIGCGSTFYLSLSASRVFQKLTGKPAHAHPSSEALLHPDLVFPINKDTLLVAISRSGETTETVAAASQFQTDGKGKVCVITCDSQSPLARKADLLLTADLAQEESVVQTRSFTSMLILSQILAGLIGSKNISTLDSLPETAENTLTQYEGLAKEIGTDLTWNRFVFLGGGFLYGIASEAMLKMKEMTLSNTEAYHPMEYRHGPMSLADHHTLIIGLIGEKARKQEVDVLKDMQTLGAKILAMANSPGKDLDHFDHVVTIHSHASAWAHPPLYLPFLQLIGYYRAVEKGLNPDNPTNLTAVIKLDSIT